MDSLQLPLRKTSPPKTKLGQWFFAGGSLEETHSLPESKPWYQVVWLTGVDYFSTLGYQPGIALLAAGALSPVATALLVLVTLFGALPVYAQVAKRSYAGQGSIAMLENLLLGWQGKILVLILIGFAATDFVITMTLSAADAAVHVIENPLLNPYIGHHQILLTLLLLTLLAVIFLKGLSEAIGLATLVTLPYLILNFIILVYCSYEIFEHKELLDAWVLKLHMRGDFSTVILASLFIFPKLALGLSGFETGVSVMPLVQGNPEDTHIPHGKIKATQKLLVTAALIMGGFLILSSFVTTILIPDEALLPGGEARGRAIAYLAHEHLGHFIGTLYDISTILILWFAGASAMAAMLHLVPRYLPRFGMAPRWVAYRRPLVMVILFICVLVTIVFKADVDAQGGAYATGVLVLILSAAIAVSLSFYKEKKVGPFFVFGMISVLFLFTLLDNVYERPDGVIIASVFVFSIITIGGISRFLRSTELRVNNLTFTDTSSQDIWRKIVGKKVHLVPLRTNSKTERIRKAKEIKKYYAVTGTMAFVHVNLLDNRSEFFSPLQLKVTEEEGNYALEVTGAIAIANSIAFISELLDPISIFIGLTRQNLMNQAFRYLLFGEGETGLMIYSILVRYWEWTPEDDIRPLIFLLSE